jgi:hypothetical protein
MEKSVAFTGACANEIIQQMIKNASILHSATVAVTITTNSPVKGLDQVLRQKKQVFLPIELPVPTSQVHYNLY